MNLNNMAEIKDKKLINRIKSSGIKTIKLEKFAPDAETFEFDLKHFLFKGLLLREKEFRTNMKDYDWTQTEGKVLCIYCSTNAIIPKWAYMLITQHAFPFATDIHFGTKENFTAKAFTENINGHDWSMYKDDRVILKGCSDGQEIPPNAYIAATKHLLPYSKSIMYGEPCSTVPVFKRPKVK
jgi:hypothetical protein